jgi:hypothetical protein
LRIGDLHHFQQGHGTPDNGTSLYGKSMVDATYDGMNVLVRGVLREWTAAVKAAIWPFDSEPGVSGLIGRKYSDMAKQLVLTAVPGTPAATNGPVTRTYPLCIFDPEFNKEIILGLGGRAVPIVFRILPTKITVNGTSQLRFYTDT